MVEGYSGEGGVNPSAFQIMLLQSEKDSARRVTGADSRFGGMGTVSAELGECSLSRPCFVTGYQARKFAPSQPPQSLGNF